MRQVVAIRAANDCAAHLCGRQQPPPPWTIPHHDTQSQRWTPTAAFGLWRGRTVAALTLSAPPLCGSIRTQEALPWPSVRRNKRTPPERRASGALSARLRLAVAGWLDFDPGQVDLSKLERQSGRPPSAWASTVRCTYAARPLPIATSPSAYRPTDHDAVRQIFLLVWLIADPTDS
jgi:hypothetical protein